MANVLNKAGLGLKDITIKNTSARYIPSELIHKRVDAGCVQEPWLSQIRMLPDLHIIASTKEYPIVYSVLITKASTLQTKAREIIALKESVIEAMKIFRDSPKESKSSVAPLLGLTEIDLTNQLDKIAFVQDSEKMKSDIPDIEEVLLKEGLISKKIDTKLLFG